ncbi:ATP-dependent Clp protease adaptor ClpS [Helicobacter saguini]|uniref:ATP-dependent Clp protease adapter protein ClpS n=1 Tax=Helicobacter saguini TaxID=1548018 RepID=A0A347VSI8_9HELI|nr:ATP-dependent Clp protease adaptor ClpS [Helicobacter saguini]MWV62488.1 ATP-dependent Clp protease adaptor ClpS [Helicobacter saguini]MWV66839.1 ATP-dependent Clp protease adaptor ClpS [Helicobacter saguini]MWV69189.1 ATP-dependent Clp protease adaptor ClpS [Helicobacter saguini]MWV71256.1 ATP-dependent Clp protease adaptor ClpS [Helicobacter saguini]TLD94225.1 ATP-dependent Clp protease adaptor ClpS [Helicobacter saguini]
MPNKYTQQGEGNFEVMPEVELAEPKMQEIIIFNDDYTSVNFVIALLMRVFDKSMTDAQNITQFIHNTGEGSCGIYPYDIAELKYIMAQNFIRDNGMPLRIDIRDIHP